MAKTISVKRLLIGFMSLILVSFSSFGSSAYAGDPASGMFTPKRGDILRKVLLDTIRPRVEAELSGDVLFVVNTMNVLGKWAFLVVTPVQKNGAPIDLSRTRYREDAEMMDGVTNYVLLKFDAGNDRWSEIDHLVGPTDVAYEPWPRLYNLPQKMFGFEN